MSSSHPYHLKRLEVQGFKSIQHTEVTLYPLTVVVGANSSGKSTLLQSILALSQAVRSDSPGTIFPLNGEYARFGTFAETNHSSSIHGPSDGLEGCIRLRTLTAFPSSVPFGLTSPRRRRRDDGALRYIDWMIELRTGELVSQGSARLARLRLHVYTVAENGEPADVLQCSLSFDDQHPTEIDELLRSRIDGPRGNELRIVPTVGVYKDTYVTGDKLERDCDAVGLGGSVPWMVYSVRSLVETVGLHWWAAMHRVVDTTEGEASSQADIGDAIDVSNEASVLDAMVDAAATVAGQWHDSQSEPYDAMRSSHEMFELEFMLHAAVEVLLTKVSRNQIAVELRKSSVRMFVAELQRRLANDEWADGRVVDSPEDLGWNGIRGTGQMIRAVFDQNIRYLGPLRRAPQVLYEPRGRDLDIGISGEFTAAVLHMYSKRQVVGIGASNGHERIDLYSAVRYWLDEFNMAADLDLRDYGRLGIGLQIEPREGPGRVDLTSVGVGVSQVLPVIVLCLLSEPGDVIVLEQPELHLHPALQQRLGDFLLKCAHSGRQLLIETHSDHLVTRVRRRVAEETGWAEGLVGLLFAEQEAGVTTFRDSLIDEYGSVQDDWPDGFLDVSAREAQALITTSLTKRYRGKPPLESDAPST